MIGRIRIHERAIQTSHEVYRVEISADGESFTEVGFAVEGTRGENSFVDHRFEPRNVAMIRVITDGCHGLTFPSFSRLSEVEAFAE